MLSSLVDSLAGCVCCCVVPGHRSVNVDTLDDDVGVVSSVALASLERGALRTVSGWWQPTERHGVIIARNRLAVCLVDCLRGYRCLA